MINRYRTANKLRRKAAFLLLLVLFLLYLLKINYDSEEFVTSENEILHLEILDKDQEILELRQTIDSLNKSKDIILEKSDTKNKINKKQVEKTKDSTLPKIIENTPEGGSEMLDEPLSDTLNR